MLHFLRIKTIIILCITIVLGSNLPANTTDEHNLTETQLYAVMNVITNFISSSMPTPVSSIVHNGTTYNIITSPHTGKVWLDRNLGANRICQSLDDTQCYGDYYQWGRNFDGHEKYNSTKTTLQATSINNVGAAFVTSATSTYNYDWAKNADENGALRAENWSKLDGSSVCPVGFRVPSTIELKAEFFDTDSADINNSNNAFDSFLKLPSAGQRSNNGDMEGIGVRGSLWSSSILTLPSGMMARDVSFSDALGASTGEANPDVAHRAYGKSIRCIKSSFSTVIDIPVFSSDSNILVEEGSISATTLVTTDATDVQYMLYGEDSIYFNINPFTGEITFKVAPDFATRSYYSLIVTATSSSGNIAMQFLNIYIADTTPPVFTSSNTATVAENQTSAITLQATDASNITYSISSSKFNINANTGVITFKIAPDYEIKNTYTFIAIATDSNGNESTQDVTIEIEDIELENEGLYHNGITYGTVISPYSYAAEIVVNDKIYPAGTQREWLDRNLGASQVCTAYNDADCYGDYYQWGRNFDGHQVSASSVTSVQATRVDNITGDFITSSEENNIDWASVVDSNGSLRTTNWFKTDGSFICPTGFRVPTVTELELELLGAGADINNRNDAFSSFLKLPVSGYRRGDMNDGGMGGVNNAGFIWSISMVDFNSYGLGWWNSTSWSEFERAYGLPVRCLRD